MSSLVTLVDVASRGRVRLSSRDPRHRPLIDPAYLSDVSDLSALTTGVRLVRDYASAAPLSGITAGEIAPGDSVRTDQEVRDYIRANVSTITTRRARARWAATRRCTPPARRPSSTRCCECEG